VITRDLSPRASDPARDASSVAGDRPTRLYGLAEAVLQYCQDPSRGFGVADPSGRTLIRSAPRFAAVTPGSKTYSQQKI
jgi:hypothetical protein